MTLYLLLCQFDDALDRHLLLHNPAPLVELLTSGELEPSGVARELADEIKRSSQPTPEVARRLYDLRHRIKRELNDAGL